MQRPEEEQVGFEDWALAQRTRPNEVLEKINALVDLTEPKNGWRRPTANGGGRPIAPRFYCGSCCSSTSTA
jgi:hypothetical protein